MRKLRIALPAAWLLVTSFWWLPPATSPTLHTADCPNGWYWDTDRQNCLPPGLPKDPPHGCLTGDGTHVSGTICVN